MNMRFGGLFSQIAVVSLVFWGVGQLGTNPLTPDEAGCWAAALVLLVQLEAAYGMLVNVDERLPRIEMMINGWGEGVSKQLDGLEERLDGLEERLNKRLDSIDEELGGFEERLEKQLGDREERLETRLVEGFGDAARREFQRHTK